MSAKLKIFYWDNNIDDGISSDEPEEMELDDALICMENLEPMDGNFFGIETLQGDTVQFMYAPGGKLSLDIPAMDKNGSYIKTVEIGECLQIIIDTYGGQYPRDIEGITFESY